MKAKSIYLVLIIIINLIACFFLGLIFIGSFTSNPESRNSLSEQQVILRQVLYGVIIGFFFSLISFYISFLFRKRMFFSNKYLLRFFIYEWLILLLVFLFICLFMYLK